MTDALETMARIISGAPFASTHSRARADAVLSKLNLPPPSAASALMDGTATVVPVEPDDSMYVAMLGVTRDPGYGHVHDAAGGAVYRAAREASPYRTTTLIDEVPDDEFTRDASAENVTAGK